MIRQTKAISGRQTVLSIVIITILIVIGAGIVTIQYRFNPAVLQKDTIVSGVAKNSLSSPASAAQSLIPLPQGLIPLMAGEIFEAQNLSDKINGKAELYLSAGFTRLVSQRFKDEGESDRWLEAYIYDMANGRNAFSVFSAQRREDSRSLDLATHSYQTPNALFFVHGRYYVEIIASEASDQALQSMKLLAEKFIQSTRTETTTINEMELFPKQDLVADSISLVSSDAFGFEGLDKVYTAEYEMGGGVLMAYLTRRESENEADKLSQAYHNFLVTFGGQPVATELPIKNAYLVEILDTYEIIFFQGAYMAGVREAEGIDQAKELIIRLYNRLKEVSGES